MTGTSFSRGELEDLSGPISWPLLGPGLQGVPRHTAPSRQRHGRRGPRSPALRTGLVGQRAKSQRCAPPHSPLLTGAPRRDRRRSWRPPPPGEGLRLAAPGGHRVGEAPWLCFAGERRGGCECASDTGASRQGLLPGARRGQTRVPACAGAGDSSRSRPSPAAQESHGDFKMPPHGAHQALWSARGRARPGHGNFKAPPMDPARTQG